MAIQTIDTALNSTQLIDDIAYLVRSEHRIQTLVALTIRPRSRSELCELTEVSSSTIRRTLREFEKRNWVRKKKYRYEAMPLGAFVSSAMEELIQQFETEQELRGVWQWLPGQQDGFTLEMCSDAVVTVSDAEDPYRPVTRFVSLLDETDEFRAVSFDVAFFEPCKDEFSQQVIDGMHTEIINPPRVARYIRSTCSTQFVEVLESEEFTVRLHDDLPNYGICLFDDRVAISGYDSDGVTVRVLVDTGSTEAREWAESMYATYRRETPIRPIEAPGE